MGDGGGVVAVSTGHEYVAGVHYKFMKVYKQYTGITYCFNRQGFDNSVYS